jgi:hypothetical protein
MDAPLPEGFVDPYDVGEVSRVLAGTLDQLGIDGVLELLCRIPGVTFVAGSPRRIFHPEVVAAVWIGPEHSVSMTLPAMHQHVVSGVVLQRTPTSAGQLPDLLAGLLASLAREEASSEEVSVVLTAARGLL